MLKGDLLPSPSFLIVSMLMLWNRGGNDCSVNPNEITEIIVGNRQRFNGNCINYNTFADCNIGVIRIL